jgi:hypothetical protein
MEGHKKAFKKNIKKHHRKTVLIKGIGKKLKKQH